MTRKLGVLLGMMALAGSLSAAKVEGSAARDTADSAVWLPIGLSLLSYPMQIPSVDHSVCGVMLNVGYGKVDNVYLLDLGLFNQTLGCMGGFQIGVSNYTVDLFGLQSGVVNIATDVYGFQIGLVNIADRLHGLQVGLANVNKAGAVFFPIINIGF